jgi:hypothetical protein
MIKELSDVIVVGSGASAVHAAYPLVEAGLAVSMLDVGFEDKIYDSLIPDAPFTTIRRTDAAQHRYFLGDDFEGIPLGPLGTGPQVTPPRQYVLQHADRLMPKVSPGFAPFESLALGGLGGAWGAVSFPYLDSELLKSGLSPSAMRPHYERVARRIGISGPHGDDLEPFVGGLHALQPALELDHNARAVYARYKEQRLSFQLAGIHIGRPMRAVLTQPLNGRKEHSYHDMDFWSNKGCAVYRPALTVRELQQHKNFSHHCPYLVETFLEEKSGHISVSAKSLNGTSHETFMARRLVLAAGSLGTTRIVLRSLGQYDVRVPLTCNAHVYVPCLHYRGLGTEITDRRHSLAQLTMIYDPTGDREHLVQGQLYSYRSLLMFRLLKESPLPYREGLRIIRGLAPHLVIWVIQHEDYRSEDCYCMLRKNGEADHLEIVYNPKQETLVQHRAYERAMRSALRRLGCWPLKSVHPGHGSSIHYGSQLPFSHEDQPLTTESSGRLRGTKYVYIADGSAFAYLPAKGLTLTLMANADRVGTLLTEDLKN